MYQNPELIIDKEFEDLIFTDTDCSPLKTFFIYKKFKKTLRGIRIPCSSCNLKNSQYQEGSTDCPYCEGLGYQWEEGTSYGWFYKKSVSVDRNLMNNSPSAAGSTIFNKQYLVIPKGLDLRQGDFILRIILEDENIPKVPIELDEMYQISESERNRSSGTAVQFTTLTLQTDNRPIFRGVLGA